MIACFNGLDQHYNIVYFGGCEVLGGEKGNQFAEDFIEQTGTVTVLGYSEKISYLDSLIIDTLYSSKFFAVDRNPFEHLQEIYDTVLIEYPRAKVCGFKFYLNSKLFVNNRFLDNLEVINSESKKNCLNKTGRQFQLASSFEFVPERDGNQYFNN